jgi:hypothetical protein
MHRAGRFVNQAWIVPINQFRAEVWAGYPHNRGQVELGPTEELPLLLGFLGLELSLG